MADTTQRTRTDYTEGPIIGAILKMGLPSLFGFLSQHIYAMADMYWVSRLPEAEAAVAAITFFSNLLWMLFAFNGLIGPGSVAIISRRYGEKDFVQTEQAIKETLFLKLFFGTIIGAVGWVFAEEILYVIGARGESLALAVGYGRVLMVGLPMMYAAYSFFTAMRGIANPAIAMALMIGSNALNAIIDPFLIFGWFGLPALGVNGAAYASVLSYTLTVVIGFVLFRTNLVNVRLSIFGPAKMRLSAMIKMLRIGLPSFLGELSFSGSRLLVTPIIASYGDKVVAAFGVGQQLFAFGISILVGLGLGLSSLIGHNLGARKLERAKTTADHAIFMGVGLMGAIGILTYFFGDFYMSFFFESSETIEIGRQLLRIWSFGFPFFALFITLEQIHMGVGHNVPPMIIISIHGWLLQLLPALLVTKVLDLGYVSVWWVFTISGIVSSLAFYLYYRRGKWMTISV